MESKNVNEYFGSFRDQKDHSRIPFTFNTALSYSRHPNQAASVGDHLVASAISRDSKNFLIQEVQGDIGSDHRASGARPKNKF